MRNLILLTIIGLLSICGEIHAQDRVRNLEFEIGGGCSIGAKYGKHLGAGHFLMELRSNLFNSRFDVGAHFCLGGTFGEDDKGWVIKNGYPSERLTCLLVVSDYNWFRGKKVSVFAGLGMGVALTEMAVGMRGSDITSSLCIMPRAGAEFFNHLRLTLDYKWLSDGHYNYTGLSVGFVFGGGVKRN